MSDYIYIIFCPSKMVSDIQKVGNIHPRLRIGLISEIVFNETVESVFAVEHEARKECRRLNKEHRRLSGEKGEFMILKKEIKGPTTSVRMGTLSDRIHA